MVCQRAPRRYDFPLFVPLHSAAFPPFFPPPNRDAVSISTEVIAHLRARGERREGEGVQEEGTYDLAGASVGSGAVNCERRLSLSHPHPNPPSRLAQRTPTDCDLARIVESSGRAKELRSRRTGMKSERGRKEAGKRGERGEVYSTKGKKGK